MSVAVIAVITPGPIVFISINYGVNQGIKKGILFALGTSIGLVILIFISIIGVGSIITASMILTKIIKIIGILVLIYISVKMIQTYISIKKMANDENNLKEQVIYKKNFLIFKEGLFLILGNPQAIVFFVSIFPQYIAVLDNSDKFKYLAILSLVFILINFTILSSYSLLSHTFLKKFFCSKKRMSILNLISGIALMLISLHMFFMLLRPLL